MQIPGELETRSPNPSGDVLGYCWEFLLLCLRFHGRDLPLHPRRGVWAPGGGALPLQGV